MIDPVRAWAEVILRCRAALPVGLVGLLISVEVAAYTSTLSALINWGSSFVINDIARATHASPRREIWVSRLTTLILFVAASLVAVLYVKQVIGWFMFINSAMVIFLLPLSFFRFFWWRFNVWGELSAIVLGLPLSILIWFVFDFQNAAKHPMWQGLGLLFGLSFLILIIATLLTPAESRTLKRFYQRCRPPGFWGPIRPENESATVGIPSTGRLIFNCTIGVLACLGLVLATNAIYVMDWITFAIGVSAALGFGGWLVRRVIDSRAASSLCTSLPRKRPIINPRKRPRIDLALKRSRHAATPAKNRRHRPPGNAPSSWNGAGGLRAVGRRQFHREMHRRAQRLADRSDLARLRLSARHGRRTEGRRLAESIDRHAHLPGVRGRGRVQSGCGRPPPVHHRMEDGERPAGIRSARRRRGLQAGMRHTTSTTPAGTRARRRCRTARRKAPSCPITTGLEPASSCPTTATRRTCRSCWAGSDCSSIAT